MNVRIVKKLSKGTLGGMIYNYFVFLNDEVSGYFYTLRKLLSIVLEYDDELIVKNTFLPLEDNCIGIKEVKGQKGTDTPFYEVIFSTYPDIEIGYRFQICDDEFKRVVGRFPFTFYSSFYFTFTSNEQKTRKKSIEKESVISS